MAETQTAPVAVTNKTAAAKATKPAVRTPARQVKAPVAKKAALPAAPVKKPRAAAKAKPEKADKPVKAKKVKLVRDSFTMPEPEYQSIAKLKERCLKAGLAVKKSEILRAAVAVLAALGDSALLATVRRVKVIKTGRPAKGSK